MYEDKIYRIKTKDGAHINEKIKEDGSRAAIQFDEDNGLQGPVDLIEVDESEFTREIYIEREERSFKQIILEDAVAPAVEKMIEEYGPILFEAGIKYMSQKVIPVVRANGAAFIDKVHKKISAKKMSNTEKMQAAVAEERESEIAVEPNENEGNAVVHTPEEVVKILYNMKFASMYIAAGIRELTNTVIRADGLDEDTALAVQKKLKELSSKEMLEAIDYMLEDKNREILDQATIQMFDAFRNKSLIVDGESVPINMFLRAEK